MIEKLDLDKRNSFGTLDWLEHWNEPSGAKLIESKINELVDAVNKIMTWRFDCDDETPAENVQKDTKSRPENVLKCPIHNIPLEYEFGYDGDYSCPNCSEPYFGSPELWQELIRTRKALDVRKKQVEIANKAFDFISTEWDNADCSRKELGACAFNAKEDISGWESDIKTAEQKD